MGLSIHYIGRIGQYKKILELIAEVKDACDSLGWVTQLFPVSKTDPLYGIMFAPEGCEPIFMTFLENGQLCSPIHLLYPDIFEDLPPDQRYTISTKTQYAGMDAHIAVLKLIRYIKDKYLSEFQLFDEGDYWETWEIDTLRKNWSRYEMIIDIMANALSKIEKIPGQPPGVADRIEQIIKGKFGNEVEIVQIKNNNS
jgi:hypothetical protein